MLALLAPAAHPLAAATATLVMTKQPAGTDAPLFSTFTMDFSIAGYGSGGPADGFNFQVDFDPTHFALVPGAAALHDTPGTAENWLRKPAQENVTAAPILTDFQTNAPGVVRVAACDLRLVPDLSASGGTTASNGFLFALTFQAIGSGSGVISVAPGAGGTFLFDSDLRPIITPAFSTNLTVNVVGPALSISRSNHLVVVTWPAGTLQTASSPPGVWTNVSGATSPFTLNPLAPRQFFRVRLP